MSGTELVIGMDVGSTTVKAVVIEPESKKILWHDYQRHHTKQPEKVLEFLTRILAAFPDQPKDAWRMFITGSGSGPLAAPTGSKFVQEVNAVALAVEQKHPDVLSVIELGGQDAKIIMFKLDAETGQRTASTSMNDKCASGTGATIDKCMIKVGAEPGFATSLHFDDSKLHHVAAKCGVFAETDIVNLVKSGIPKDEVLNSLADAIVLQNLSVLTRGNTLKPRVLLLGGPNTYLPFLRECWQKRIPETWRDRGFDYPKDVPPEELIFVPENADLYAAFGAAMFGIAEGGEAGRFNGIEGLNDFISNGRRARLGEQAGPPLSATSDETVSFADRYKIPKFVPATFEPGQLVRGVIGLDGGSTSSKAVLIGEDGELLCKAYQLSKGNPIQDTKELVKNIVDQVEGQGAKLECIGFGATGYAADVLDESVLADVNIVETVAHMMSAVHFFGDVDVICDIGGQDIKVLFMKNGDIQNFKLSNSCSAGNGMLLQAMADQFGIPVTEYAETAFRAELAPKFSYGCAVFLDSDRVNFQKEGFQKEELLAGLAQVLPKNVWQYVVQIPRLASLGKKFVLQGGTQYNLAAVKAQVDYILQRVPGGEVYVHPHTGEAGAIGAAIETLRRWKRTGKTRFVGLDAVLNLEYTTKTDDSTTCHFCPNECKRTFIDTHRPDGSTARYISGFSCEKGTVESKEAMLSLMAERKKTAAAFPNLVDYESKQAFVHFYKPEPMPAAGTPIEDVKVTKGLFRIKREKVTRPFLRSSEEAAKKRKSIRIGMPRVLNMYSTAPFFRTYFESLGIGRSNVVFSDHTSEELFVEGAKYGSIDPCFPSKVVQSHIHNLLFHHHEPERNRQLDYIFFPILTHVMNFVTDTQDNASCPIVAGTPDVVKAAFTKEVDFFKTRNMEYLDPALSFVEPTLLAKRMFDTFGARLGITEDENDHACKEGWKALEIFDHDLQEKGRAILEVVEAEDRIAILVLNRPYHSDPGLNHGIPEEFQVLGYPILSIRSIPRERAYLDRYFRKELESGVMKSPLEINHVWPENYSVNSTQKVWGATFAAHHPNVAALDLSSFKCGHDAPTYGLIDSILQTSKTPVAALHDLDANKPGGSIKIRVKTYAHSLLLHQERLEDVTKRQRELAYAVDAKRLELLELKAAQLQSLQKPDTEVERLLAEQREKMKSYEVVIQPPEPTPGLMRLGKKTEDGSIVRIGHKGASPPPAEVNSAGPSPSFGPQPQKQELERSHRQPARRSNEDNPMTQHVSTDSLKKKTLPIAGQPAIDVDAELSRFEADERARLGLQEEEQWLEKMANLSFTKKEKGKITLLIGGLTMAHDYLVSGGFRSLGYTVVPLDCPDNDALRVGKEFGNRGQCNPTYFTVGNLVKFLIYLRDEKGLSTKQVVDDYVFLTAGACGPCRFGMYVTEYRKALRDAGFDGFRVMLFQQQGGLSQATGEESGLELTPPFFIALLKGLLAGDIINGMGYRLRPYEVVPGATDKAIAEAKKLCYDALQQKKSVLLALRRAKKVFEAVEVDRTLVKPKVAIIGEFWAMTTEGDGNYALQRFLESEGAECDIQFVTAWILYNIWEVRFDTASRALLKAFDGGKYGLNGVGEHGVFIRKVGLWLGDKALRTAFQTFAHAGGFYGYHLPDMDAVADVAAPYYNNDLRGGEGHMEVGKLILNVVKNKATMTLSVKPFGCMPSSSVSDGVQSLITEKFPGTIYCAVETSGDGAVNFYSRVQMYMFKAKQAAAAELEKALGETGLTLEQVRGYLKQHRGVGSSLHKAPHAGGTTTADLVYEVAELYGKSRWQRAAIGARSLAKAGVELVTSAARIAPEKLPQAARVVKAASLELGEIAKEKGPLLAQQATNAVREKLATVIPFIQPKPAAAPIAAE